MGSLRLPRFSSRRLASSTARAGFHQPDTLGRSDLGRARKENTCTSGCCERRGCLGKSPRSSWRLVTLGQRRGASAPIAESGTARGPGSLIDWSALVRSTRRFRQRARLDHQAGSRGHRGRLSVPPRRSAGSSTRQGTRGRFCRVRAQSSDGITTKWSRRANQSVRS